MEDKRQYNTRQRSEVLSFFERNKNSCFSAKYVMDNIGINIGEATIYRLLAKLAEEGSLKRFEGGGGRGATYQYNSLHECAGHFHLKCLVCGEIHCMECSFMHGMEKHVEEEHEFVLDNTKTVLLGTCKGCKEGKAEEL